MFKTNQQSRESGFTLVEAMVALAIFIGVVVPLLAMAFDFKQTARARDKFTAACLLEQEVVRAQVSPQSIPPIQPRTARGQRWTITCQRTGDPLMRCNFAALKGNEKFAETTILIHTGKGGQR